VRDSDFKYWVLGVLTLFGFIGLMMIGNMGPKDHEIVPRVEVINGQQHICTWEMTDKSQSLEEWVCRTSDRVLEDRD
jgi:hypothetical protein